MAGAAEPVPVPNYGSIPSPTRPSAKPIRGRVSYLAWFSVAAVCSVIIFVVFSPARMHRAVLDAKQGTAQLDSTVVFPPSEEEMAPFQPGAEKVFAHVGVKPADIDTKTDLREACGDFLLPCISTVGQCIMSHTGDASGREVVETDACQCYVQGNTMPIEVPDRPEVDVQCSFICLSAIKGMFQQHLHEVNGDLAASVACPRTFENLAHEVYANEFMYDVQPSEEDTDGLAVESVVDEGVLHAADAVLLHVNTIRSHECPDIAQLSGPPAVSYARRGEVEAGLGQYLLEFEAGGQEFSSRVVHLPAYKQRYDPATSSADPQNLLGSFEVMKLSPDPCATGPAAALAQTVSRVAAINRQQLSWRAEYHPHLEGATMDQFGMGLEWPSEAEIQANTVWLAEDASAEEIPAAWDARDHLEGQQPCRAFDVLNQGGCGSCYAFAAASALSARFCKDSERKWDVVLSPQEMMDCTRGCAGGWPLTVYKKISTGEGFTVESWCDPYTKKKQVCGDTCEEGQKFRGLEGTAVIVSGRGAKGVENMQRHLMTHGPGVVAVTVFKDFHSYKSGVYVKSEGAKRVGGHAVSLVGWGTEDGVDYWLLQNSWGPRTGDKGFWKIRRGTNECGIERTGLMVVKPELPLDCTAVECANGGTPDRRCQCQCPAPWEGERCETCALQCHHGGKFIASGDGLGTVAETLACSKCFCPEGTLGSDCGTKVEISPDKGDDKTAFTLSASFLGEKPTMGSFVALYSEDATETAAHVEGSKVFLCGESYDAATNGGVCPETVEVALPNPGRGGKMLKTYKVVLVHYNPPNEFGLEGYPVEIAADDTVGELTVVKKIGKKQGGVQVLAAVSGRSVREQMARAVALEESVEEGMEERRRELDALVKYVTEHDGPYGEVRPPNGKGDAAKPTDYPEPEREEADKGMKEEGVGAGLPGSLTVSGSIGERPVVWTSGAPSTLCYRLPPAYNLNPKKLLIFVGDGADGMYYPTGLLDAGPDQPLPTAGEGCQSLSVSPGIPAGAEYTLRVQHEARVLAATGVLLAHAALAWEAYTLGDEDGQPVLTLPVAWSITPAAATASDVIKVVDAQGDVVDWFFTSCSCKGPPGAEAVPQGQAEVKLYAPVDKTPGQYYLHLHPEGEEFVGAVADDWIPWNTAWGLSSE